MRTPRPALEIERPNDVWAPLDLPVDRLVELDLGCGKGGFTCALAARWPERLVLGADWPARPPPPGWTISASCGSRRGA
jgi:tRNA G46 methylase TrmB